MTYPRNQESITVIVPTLVTHPRDLRQFSCWKQNLAMWKRWRGQFMFMLASPLFSWPIDFSRVILRCEFLLCLLGKSGKQNVLYFNPVLKENSQWLSSCCESFPHTRDSVHGQSDSYQLRTNLPTPETAYYCPADLWKILEFLKTSSVCKINTINF